MVVINVYICSKCVWHGALVILFEKNDNIHINYTVLSTLFTHTGAVFQESQVPIFKAFFKYSIGSRVILNIVTLVRNKPVLLRALKRCSIT